MHTYTRPTGLQCLVTYTPLVEKNREAEHSESRETVLTQKGSSGPQSRSISCQSAGEPGRSGGELFKPRYPVDSFPLFLRGTKKKKRNRSRTVTCHTDRYGTCCGGASVPVDSVGPTDLRRETLRNFRSAERRKREVVSECQRRIS
ncbi:hypothetical protein VZT92_012276 [Zoarces viviparus]|uniref:Uncharacterized protein n=1 Tax=Zoarces viviparus TaxID=48416 RepID=A0AAW1F7U1_ZOAVI